MLQQHWLSPLSVLSFPRSGVRRPQLVSPCPMVRRCSAWKAVDPVSTPHAETQLGSGPQGHHSRWDVDAIVVVHLVFTWSSAWPQLKTSLLSGAATKASLLYYGKGAGLTAAALVARGWLAGEAVEWQEHHHRPCSFPWHNYAPSEPKSAAPTLSSQICCLSSSGILSQCWRRPPLATTGSTVYTS